MMVLGDASAKVIVGEIGGRVGINLLLVALTLHLADAEGSIEGQFLVLTVKLARIQQVERMVYVVVVAGGNLFVPQRVIVKQILGVDIAVTLTLAAAQLI